MKFTPTRLPDVILIEPVVHKDPRGFFMESFQTERYKNAGIPGPFVQDNHSRSVRGTLRGLHAQWRRPQGKLVRAIRGEIFDVVVDIRKGSPTFKQWVGVRLSAENFKQLYIPPGFAHGFCVLSGVAEFEYKCTDYYDPGGELTVLWNDPEIGIEWPVQDPLLSEKDRGAPPLSKLGERIPVYHR